MGKPYKAKPGQFVTSLESIRQKCGKGISLQNIRTAIKRFEKYEFLTNEVTKVNRLITIVNWEFYQDKNSELTKKLTVNQQSVNNQLTTNNNDKQCNNETNNNITSKKSKKRIYSDDDPNKKLAVLLFKLIQKNQNIKEPDLDKWANTIRLTIESDKRTGKDVQDMIVWATSNDFWSGVILSATSLRKHFDKMLAQKNKRKQQSVSDEELPETGEEW
ncbi:hypothetical protein [Enterococcus sp. DIV1054d]|uniref:hypothetical protein n=1 Tax=Enterococcus sp. DIV1054d TaxID=2774789 RepID=UPI003D2F9E25